jgi:hypothetical protein
MTSRLKLLLVLLGFGVFILQTAVAQPTQVVRPDVRARAARDLPTWEDPGSHFRLRLAYDGKRFKLISAAMGEGSARSYLSQRSDIVVVVLNADKKVVRQFNLPDPLELRAWDRAQGGRSEGVVIGSPRIGNVGDRTATRETSVAAPAEHTTRLKSTEFDLFVPRLPGAQQLEFHKNAVSGRLLGRVDLTSIR